MIKEMLGMARLNAVPVDLRDVTWEDTHPVFRVYFWDEKRVSDEYEVTHADITDVLEWAKQNSAGRGWEIWVCLTRHGEHGGIKLQEFDMPPDLGQAL